MPIPDMPLDLADLVAVAEEAGRLLMEGFRGDAGTRTKSRGDLVTEYDERCETLLRERLTALAPEATVVGEEQGGEVADGWVFYVDPIDGTNNYAHRHPWFCLSIGLWHHCADTQPGATPAMGVVHAPAMHRTYAAERGKGAHLNGERLVVSGTSDLEASLLASGFPSSPWEAPRNNYREFVTLDAHTHGVRRCSGAALEIAMVAGGSYDGFWDEGLAPWDLAAGALLVLEAGGQVTSLEGAPFSLSSGQLVASNGSVHSALVHALAHARALPPLTEVP
ncbi:MAG: inositol monophosphatase [Sandaracinaceae bacterium]